MIVLQYGSSSLQIRDLGMQEFRLILNVKSEHNMDGVLRTRIQLPHTMRYIVKVGMLTYEKINEFRLWIMNLTGTTILYTDPDDVVHTVRFVKEPQIMERKFRGIIGHATLELEGEA